MDIAERAGRPTRTVGSDGDQQNAPARAGKRLCGVRVLDLDWPAPDQWTADQRSDFADELRALARTPGLTGIVLTGRALFFSPAPQSALTSPEALDDILLQVTDSPIPIVAAIVGDASGAGLELAIACAARVATSKARFSLPAIDSAQLPSLQTLRQLPGLIGLEAAVDMVALACPLGGVRAQSLGLLAAVEDDDLLAAATRAFGMVEAIGAGSGPQSDPIDLQAQFFLIRRTLRARAPGQIAPLSAIHAMEAAAQMRPRIAKAEVGRIASELSQSQQGAALRHAAQVSANSSRPAANADLDDARLSQRLWWPMAREAIHLLDEGASPAQVDKCFTDFGFPTGPFAKADAIGFAKVFTSDDDALASGNDWAVYSPTLDLMADSGRLGGDSPGWYRPVTASSKSRFEPVVDLLIQSSAISQRLRRAPISDGDIIERCLNAAVNAAFVALGEREDLTEADIDAIWLSCLDFPRWKGGPVYQARVRGLEAVVAELAASMGRRNTAGPACERLVAAARAGEPPADQTAGD